MRQAIKPWLHERTQLYSNGAHTAESFALSSLAWNGVAKLTLIVLKYSGPAVIYVEIESTPAYVN